MPHPIDIDALERRLWKSADTLRSNSSYASNEYFMPVMGLIFLRHAFSRYLTAREEIEAGLPTRGGKTRPLTREDFSGRGAIYLRKEAQFEHLVGLPDSEDRAQAVVEAMEAIEEDYPTLQGELPKAEYQKLDNDVMGQLLRTFNDAALKRAGGDVFGRIYEYFLTQFADQKAHDNGEFFTPVSLVQTIVNVIEPARGTVLDPACGSGGMFVQSAHFIEAMKQDPTKRATFYGLEKNETTIRLGKMNLAVHGLEGQVKQANTFYEDPHALRGQADFVMANPPFNVDEVDAGKVKGDPRLPFGLPGTNKHGKVSNANYLWASYFYSYLDEKGRAGFVMSSQASSASRDEQAVRQKLVESGAVDVMMAIRGGFFYTRSVPCELWFLDKGKPEARRDQVLMLDARGVHRKVSRTVYEFSPEQLANLTSIVWLYRGEAERFLGLVADHLTRAVREAQQTAAPLAAFTEQADALHETLQPFLAEQPEDAAHADPLAELTAAREAFAADGRAYRDAVQQAAAAWPEADRDNDGLRAFAETFAPLAEESRGLFKQADLVYRLFTRLLDTCEDALDPKAHDAYSATDARRARKALDEARRAAVDQLKQVRYFYRQADWLQERFPEAKLEDVPGLVKCVRRAEIEANGWSLSPGRYVGVAPPEVDEDFDFEEAMREIHVDLADLGEEAADLSATIAKNFEELGVQV